MFTVPELGSDGNVPQEYTDLMADGLNSISEYVVDPHYELESELTLGLDPIALAKNVVEVRSRTSLQQWLGRTVGDVMRAKASSNWTPGRIAATLRKVGVRASRDLMIMGVTALDVDDLYESDAQRIRSAVESSLPPDIVWPERSSVEDLLRFCPTVYEVPGFVLGSVGVLPYRRSSHSTLSLGGIIKARPDGLQAMIDPTESMYAPVYFSQAYARAVELADRFNGRLRECERITDR